MTKIKVKAIVSVSGITDNKKDSDDVMVESHWNYNNLIQLTVNEEQVTIDGNELALAIKNCMNTGI